MTQHPTMTPAVLRAGSLVLALVATVGTAQAEETVRFATNAGTFDVMLNPTGNPNLQSHVLNFLQYVNSGRYAGTVINRTQDNFVIQMGGFVAPGETLDTLPSNGFEAVQSFDPVIVDADFNGVIDFDTAGLSNTRGEISLALNSTGPNSGTSSFFINLVDNSFLDNQGFVPFARIVDMTPIDAFEALPDVNLTQEAGTSSNNLGYTDVPVVDGDEFLIIDSAKVIPEPSAALLLIAAGLAPVAVRRRA